MNYNRKYKVNKNFFRKWSKNMAYVLGWIYSDGNLSQNGTNFKITSIDKDILILINSLMKSDYPIKNYKTKEGKDYYVLYFCYKYMYNDLLKLGLFPNKSKTISLPEVPDNYFFHFLRGIIEGDGSIYVENLKYKNKQYNILRTSIISGSYKFLNQLQLKISKLIQLKPKNIYKNHTAYNIRYSQKESKILLKKLYENAKNNFLQRKYNIWQRWNHCLSKLII